jgi:hypothetical protein
MITYTVALLCYYKKVTLFSKTLINKSCLIYLSLFEKRLSLNQSRLSKKKSKIQFGISDSVIQQFPIKFSLDIIEFVSFYKLSYLSLFLLAAALKQACASP